MAVGLIARCRLTLRLCLVVGALLLLSVSPAGAVWLEWDRNSETNVAGYRIYWGVQTRTYTSIKDVGTNILGEVTQLTPATTYYFAVTAYDTDGLESDFSDEVSYTVPVPNSAPVPTPDVYRVLAGTTLTIPAQDGLLTNDVDPDGDALWALLAAEAARGTVLLNNDGSFSYAPSGNHSGQDTFAYAVSDGRATSAVCTVTILFDEPPVDTSPCAGCYTSLDALLAARSSEFLLVAEARNSPTSSNCFDAGVMTYAAVARASARYNDSELTEALGYAASCLSLNVETALADREEAIGSIPPSKYTQSAKSRAAALRSELGGNAGDFVAHARQLMEVASGLKRLDQMLVMAQPAPSALSNRVLACALVLPNGKVNRAFSFDAERFAASDSEGLTDAGSYLYSRTSWNTATVILINEGGDLTIFECTFSRSRGRITGPEARGTFRMQ